LKRRVPTERLVNDLRKLNNAPADQYLFTDDDTGELCVLGKGGPGSTHTVFSRTHMCKMKTKLGSLEQWLLCRSPRLHRMLERLLDPTVKSKATYRDPNSTVVQNVLKYLQMHMGIGCAFPPVHAKLLADRFLPRDRDSVVVDPCAGWGGRLVGTLLVNRRHHVQYIGIDPEQRNVEAYESLKKIVVDDLANDLAGPRDAVFYSEPFEDWIDTADGLALRGQADLVMTSPPYFTAENYNPENPDQSANRYPGYDSWRKNFYRPLIHGAFDILKPNGLFALNVADVKGAPTLVEDARELARKVGFISVKSFDLALSLSPGAQKTAGKATNVVSVDGKLFKSEPVLIFRKPALPSDITTMSWSMLSHQSMAFTREEATLISSVSVLSSGRTLVLIGQH